MSQRPGMDLVPWPQRLDAAAGAVQLPANIAAGAIPWRTILAFDHHPTGLLLPRLHRVAKTRKRPIMSHLGSGSSERPSQNMRPNRLRDMRLRRVRAVPEERLQGTRKHLLRCTIGVRRSISCAGRSGNTASQQDRIRDSCQGEHPSARSPLSPRNLPRSFFSERNMRGFLSGPWARKRSWRRLRWRSDCC